MIYYTNHFKYYNKTNLFYVLLFNWYIDTFWARTNCTRVRSSKNVFLQKKIACTPNTFEMSKVLFSSQVRSRNGRGCGHRAHKHRHMRAHNFPTSPRAPSCTCTLAKKHTRMCDASQAWAGNEKVQSSKQHLHARFVCGGKITFKSRFTRVIILFFLRVRQWESGRTRGGLATPFLSFFFFTSVQKVHLSDVLKGAYK